MPFDLFWQQGSSHGPPTSNHKLQVKRVLSCSVGGNTRVDAGIPGRDRLYDEGVYSVLTDQHLVSTVRADGLPIQLPAEIWGW